MRRRAAAAVLAVGGAILLSAAPARARDLSFEERVRAQAAVEKVYYSHETGTRRSFEEAVSQAVLEKKVRTYLQQSVALERIWNTPVTAGMLQKELRRMARQTRMPERLQELYDALGNDPFLIEECLARPALVDRLARNFFSGDQRFHADERRQAQEIHDQLAGGRLDPRADHPGRHEVSLVRVAPEENSGPERAPDAARAGRNNAELLELPPEEFDRWAKEVGEGPGQTGPLAEEREMFVVRAVLERGQAELRLANFVVPKRPWEDWWDKARMDLDPDEVRAVASGSDSLPPPRASSAGPWSPESVASSGASSPQAVVAAAPVDDSWDNGSLYAVPDRRSGHTAVWTGSLMIVWGGFNNGTYLNTGARYDPATDTWTPTSVAATGASSGAPAGRDQHVAVWTGTYMVVWGGYSPTSIPILPLRNPQPMQTFNPTNTGGRYEPIADTWQPTLLVDRNPDDPSDVDAPAPRYGHSGVWVPDVPGFGAGALAIWGGYGVFRYDCAGNPELNYLDNGAVYFPDFDFWAPYAAQRKPTPENNNSCDSVLPSARWKHSAVWTGDRMVVWGGYGVPVYAIETVSCTDPNTGQKTDTNYCVAYYTQAGTTKTFTFDFLNTGSRFNFQVTDPFTNEVIVPENWTPTSTTAAPDAREYATSVWTGSKMIVWGGFANGKSFATGGQYDPAGDTWTPTKTSGAPVSRYFHTAVWTGSKMIVWGGLTSTLDSNGDPMITFLKDGGRYDPAANSWAAMSLPSFPSGRYNHSAVWAAESTPPLMIVWGGNSDGSPVSTGARYDPAADSWTPTSFTNAASARAGHSGIWTGSRMIVWGGSDRWSGAYFNSGGSYDPATDTWTQTSTVGAPSGRAGHSAAWAKELNTPLMIVWGGLTQDFHAATRTYFTDGGKYDPAADTWAPISSTNAPPRRSSQSTIWTGSQMVVWGGSTFDGVNTTYLNSGSRYSPATDTWAATSPTGAPSVRDRHAAVWTGSKMIVWGGYGTVGASATFLDTGGRYDPATDTWTPTLLTEDVNHNNILDPGTCSNAPQTTCVNDADCSGGGTCVGAEDRNGNGIIDTAPLARREAAAVWTGSRMIVWGGIGSVEDPSGFFSRDLSLDSGGQYDPVADTWTPTSTTGVPLARFGASAIWTGTKVLFWGGARGPFGLFPATGGRYDPASDSWLDIATAGAPSGRYTHNAVWTGTQMLVWGGFNGAPLDSGGRYSSITGLMATFYRDADGDGLGDFSSTVQAYEQPAGYVSNSVDCNDGSTSVWATPSEARDVGFSDGASLVWRAPSAPGATTVYYDAVRSGTASDFVSAATCVATSSVSTSAADPAAPAPSKAFFYLVRPQNGCPDGQGPLGTDSNGTPRTARSCP